MWKLLSTYTADTKQNQRQMQNPGPTKYNVDTKETHGCKVRVELDLNPSVSEGLAPTAAKHDG